MEFQRVNSVRPIAPYIGGKRQLSKRLVTMIDDVDHHLYAEPFVGMGGVFFRRTRRPRVEVINDFNRDVANLFRILNRHYAAFIDMLRFQLTTRADFDRLIETSAEVLTDLERAARFLYLQRTRFGGKVTGRTFGVSRTNGARFNLSTLEPMLQEVHERLSGVVIECLDWRAFIERYDRDDTLFYLDPPYYGSEADYGRDLFTRDRFEEMADVLRSIDGKFILSLNDHLEIRAIFAGFTIQAAEVTYTVGGADKAKKFKELIICKA